jgi:hypothetical protein
MPLLPATAKAVAGGTAQVRIQHNRSGLQWVVSQLSVESNPLRTGATATIKLNGQFVSDTPFLPQTASGQPFITLNASDLLTADFAFLTVNDVAILNIFYVETYWGNAPYVGGVV